MNLNPGGKQAHMRDGWFIRESDGMKVIQSMIYPSTHATFPNQPKGMRAVLEERGLWNNKLKMKCKGPASSCMAPDCCATRILSLQPDFKAQKSLVQETITNAGHLCIFLPKYHCELNFIEFFWGAVKKYLRDNCDYTFETLKANMPLAMDSVKLSTVRKWELRTIRWRDAYRSGLTAKDAQNWVKKFGSRTYKSHRRVYGTQGRQFDAQ
jgi:hypothetical protein